MTTPRRAFTLLAPVLALVAAGCTSPTHRAPVEDRTPSTRNQTAPAAAGAAAASPATAPAQSVATPSVPEAPKAPPPGAENAGKPGYYTVKPGDTLIRIGLDSGQNWRDIARWNNIDNPNLIEVGQVVRVVPPVVVASTQPVAPAGRVETRPLEPARPANAGAPASAPTPNAAAAPGAPATGQAPVAAPPAAAVPAAPAGPATAPASAAREPDEDVQWAWPAAGTVVTAFDEGRNKGLAIAGKAGDPVLAAADGRVVYAGSGLRGYGNLVIVKHNNTFLTAYAHNQTLLVKEDQAVRRGQKIAEMGSTDAERVQLHFEIRRQGKPVDPSRLLPAR